jgi:hypothetical protein
MGFDPAARLGDVELPPQRPQPVAAKKKKKSPPKKNQPPALADALAIEPFAATVALELTHFKGGFLPRTVDPRMQATRLTSEQAVALKLLTCSLHAQSQRRANGRHVENNSDAVRWLLDAIVEQIPEDVMRRLKESASGQV